MSKTNVFPLAALPPELLFDVLRYLPLQSLSALRRTSKAWNQRFVENESYIYRNAAYHHAFIPSTEWTLKEAIRKVGDIVAGVTSWSEFCRRRFTLETNWLGRGSAWCKEFAGDHDDVHRIKIDEERGIVITTHQDGGLNVRDLDTDEILWALPRTYVRECAHCEYGNGFLIFDRFGQSKEVWRLAAEYDESPAPPDELQQQISFTINNYMPRSKGSFRPWAVLTTPEFNRAFRFVYPTLLVAGSDKAYLWDVLTCELSKIIPEIQAEAGGEPLGAINYVELSAKHVYICGTRQLRVFDRTNGALVYHISTGRVWRTHQAIPMCPITEPTESTDLEVLPVHPSKEMSTARTSTEFVAVHVSPDCKTVVALTMDSHLLIIKDIFSLIGGEAKLKDVSLTVSFTQKVPGPGVDTRPTAIYLAFEYGRVGLIMSAGIFTITLDATKHGIVDYDIAEQQRLADLDSDVTTTRELARSAFPFMRCCQILPFDTDRLLATVSCLQMTQTRMLFTWNPRAMPGLIFEDEEPEHPSAWQWMPFLGHAALQHQAVDEDDEEPADLLDPHMPPLEPAAAPQPMPGGPPVGGAGGNQAPPAAAWWAVPAPGQGGDAAIAAAQAYDNEFPPLPGQGGHANFFPLVPIIHEFPPLPGQGGNAHPPPFDPEDDEDGDIEADDEDEDWEDVNDVPMAHFLLNRSINQNVVACIGFTAVAAAHGTRNTEQAEHGASN